MEKTGGRTHRPLTGGGDNPRDQVSLGAARGSSSLWRSKDRRSELGRFPSWDVHWFSRDLGTIPDCSGGVRALAERFGGRHQTAIAPVLGSMGGRFATCALSFLGPAEVSVLLLSWPIDSPGSSRAWLSTRFYVFAGLRLSGGRSVIGHCGRSWAWWVVYNKRRVWRGYAGASGRSLRGLDGPRHGTVADVSVFVTWGRCSRTALWRAAWLAVSCPSTKVNS